MQEYPEPSKHPLVILKRKQNKANSLRHYGFWANPNHPLWLQCSTVIRQMTVHQFLQLFQRSSTAYHNLCTQLTPPLGTERLLWLGLKFCIQRPIPKPNIEAYIERLTYDIRTKYMFAGADDGTYDPKLYLPSQEFSPKKTPIAIELAIQEFHYKLRQLNALNAKPRRYNLSPTLRRILKDLKTNKQFFITPTDKNLGPAILECTVYKERCLKDHLLDRKTYRRLTALTAFQKLRDSSKQMFKLIQAYKEVLPEHELTYFERSFSIQTRIPQFYTIPKVHKTPWKTRPIVSCMNSQLGYLSKWADHDINYKEYCTHAPAT